MLCDTCMLCDIECLGRGSGGFCVRAVSYTQLRVESAQAFVIGLQGSCLLAGRGCSSPCVYHEVCFDVCLVADLRMVPP